MQAEPVGYRGGVPFDGDGDRDNGIRATFFGTDGDADFVVCEGCADVEGGADGLWAVRCIGVGDCDGAGVAAGVQAADIDGCGVSFGGTAG